jgi:tetratricopeptide (TPR) repeat protein
LKGGFKGSESAFPFLLALFAGLLLLVPGIAGEYKFWGFLVGVVLASVTFIVFRFKPNTDPFIDIVVERKNISFPFELLPKDVRPKTDAVTTEIFEQGVEEYKSGSYASAAKLYASAFDKGGSFWPAKVNEGSCYQLLGKFERALQTYDQVVRDCADPKFVRQALGNGGEILVNLARAAAPGVKRDALLEKGYERHLRAHQTEETFNSVFNLWESSILTGRSSEADSLLEKLRSMPEYTSRKELFGDE